MGKGDLENIKVCPKCGGKIVEILYGEPTEELFNAAERGEVILGGCCIAFELYGIDASLGRYGDADRIDSGRRGYSDTCDAAYLSCKVCKQSGWIEIAGAGMVDPRVFGHVGWNPEEVSGYAFGFGVERIAMIKYGIPDIRWLYENDLRFLAQTA